MWSQQPFKRILVLDEPDVHLHPEYVTRLAQFFNNVFQDLENVTCIIATHSPEFIGENPEHVYQISLDSKTIMKIDNLKARDELLSSLGKKFDLAYLAPKIIFTEGTDSGNKRLEDHYVYQKLMDPTRASMIFIPANSKTEAGIAKKFVQFFFDQVSKASKDLNIFVLVDQDEASTEKDSNNVNVTPYNCLENIFLLDPLSIVKACSQLGFKKYSEEEIIKVIQSFIPKNKNILSVDGKECLYKVYGYLKKDGKVTCGLKALQIQILNNMDIDRFPSTVKQFFKKL